VILDVMLPELSGFEVLRRLRSVSRIPVIMLTTSSSARDVTACYDRGVNCYVVKPLDLDDFTRLVQAIHSFWFGVAELPPG